MIVQPTYMATMPFSERLAGVQVSGKWGFVDKHGNLVIQPAYDEVGYFQKVLTKLK